MCIYTNINKTHLANNWACRYIVKMRDTNAASGPKLIPDQADFLLRCLLEHSLDAIYFKDLESRFILVNQAAARLYKLESPEQAVGKTDFDFFTSEHAAVAFADEQEIIRTGKALAGKEERETWPDGSVTWSTTTKMPLCNSQGQIIGTFGISRNITERMHAIEQIAEQAALIDIAPDAIMVCDLQFQILFWNKGAEQVYGWLSEEALGKTTHDLLCAKKRRNRHTEISQTVLSQGIWKGEAHHVTKDERTLVMESRRMLVRSMAGNPKSILIINTDVTEKKKAEAQFLRAQRMESIGTLAGGIAHDLNNILAPILVGAGLLKMNAGEADTQIIDTIETCAKRGASIVQQVLSFARGIKVERTEVQLRHILKEIEAITKDTFPKDIDVDVFTAPNLWPVQGDPTQLHQMLFNLCVNARDAMPQGGLLTITAVNSDFDKLPPTQDHPKGAPHVTLRVTDTGMGMTPEVLDKIFEPFFTTKEVGKGTGLGLSTTFGIVKGHDGIISAQSELGKGTTFQIHLPAEIHSTTTSQPTKQVALPKGNGELILLVDDEAPILSIYSKTLQAFGYKVLTAVNGAEAVSVYIQHQKEIAVVITDMSMPIMDGLSAIRAIRGINPNARLIAASGLHDNAALTEAAAAGITHFLNKPCSATNLLKTLQKILSEPAEESDGAVYDGAYS